MTETDKKREMIIEGALKRFSHFGINKTTMAEIADDLSVSKPSLYYYYPDKQSLVVAVVERVLNEYLDEIEGVFAGRENADCSLFALLEQRKKFYQKYFMLYVGAEFAEAYLKNEALLKVLGDAKQREVAIIADCFQRGIKAGKYKELDAIATAKLYLDTLVGLRACMKLEKNPFPVEENFEEVLSKQKQLTQIFLDGIKDYSDGSKNPG